MEADGIEQQPINAAAEAAAPVAEKPKSNKKTIAVILAVLVVIVGAVVLVATLNGKEKSAGGDEPSEPISETSPIEDMTKDELLKVIESGKEYPDGFVGDSLLGYRRIVYSSRTEEEAKAIVLEEFDYQVRNSVKYSVEVDFVKEKYTGVVFRYTENRSGSDVEFVDKVVSFNSDYLVYDETSTDPTFKDKSREFVKEVLDIAAYTSSYDNRSEYVLGSVMKDAGDSYEYVYYYASVNYGDWGLQNSASLNKRILSVNKQTGLGENAGEETIIESFAYGEPN